MARAGAPVGEFPRAICKNKCVPDVKTIASYEIAIEGALEKFFFEKSSEGLIKVLRDAATNRKWPKRYRSLSFSNFKIGNCSVDAAVFDLRKNQIRIVIYGKRIIISADDVTVKGDIYSINTAFENDIVFFQESLKQIKRIR